MRVLQLIFCDFCVLPFTTIVLEKQNKCAAIWLLIIVFHRILLAHEYINSFNKEFK
jgi:hypothetical protein